jgi:hypothetical protein
VESFAELHDRLFSDMWQGSISRFRSDFAFRGVSSCRFDLATSLLRLGGRHRSQEAALLRNFRKYAHRDAVPGDSVWNWLALGQHHGLPTRILDWSFSPYVALHFATEDLDRYHEDAVVWCVNYVEAHRQLPAPLRAALEAQEANVFNTEMLGEVAATLSDFDGLSDSVFVAFFEPPSLDDRIVNQFALFSLMSSPSARLDDWLEENPALYRRLVIPASLKWEVRDKLDQANVTERVLFPGLDGLSHWLRRYYMPAPGNR